MVTAAGGKHGLSNASYLSVVPNAIYEVDALAFSPIVAQGDG
jgi:hypothetical protein